MDRKTVMIEKVQTILEYFTIKYSKSYYWSWKQAAWVVGNLTVLFFNLEHL